MGKYISFTPVDAGFVNVLMNLELALSLSEITGRTLIIPPDFWLFSVSKDFSKDNFIDIFQYIDKEYLYSNFNCIDLYEVPELKGLFDLIDQDISFCQIRGKRPYSYTSNIKNCVSDIKEINFGEEIVLSDTQKVFFSEQIKDYSDFVKFAGKRSGFNLDFEEKFLHFERNLYGMYWYSVYPGGPQERNELKRKINNVLMYDKKFEKLSRVVYDSIGPYNSLHVRRNDFIEDRSEDLHEISQQSKFSSIVKYLFKDNNPIYISTDEKDLSFFDHLKKFKTVYFYNDFYDISDELGASLIEQLVCSNSELFYGTHKSTYSKRINALRGYKNKQTSDGMGINNLYYPLCDYDDPLPWTKHGVYWYWDLSSHPQWTYEQV